MRSIVLALALTGGLAACAPKHAGHPRATSPPSPVLRLTAYGVPDVTWSEDRLNAFEYDLMRAEAADDGRYHDLIQNRRQALDAVREKTIGAALKSMRSAANVDAAAPLLRERDELVHDVNTGGNPDHSWTTDKLMALKRKLARIDEIGRHVRQKLGLNTLNYDEFTKVVAAPLNKILSERLRGPRPLDQVKGNILL